MSGQTAFFYIDHRKFRIRRKCHGCFFFNLIIVFDIGASALFVCSQNKPDVLFQRDTKILYGPHGIESSHCRSLVICGTSSVETAVFQHRLIGSRHLPAFSGRDYIQVSQNIQLPLLMV